MSRPMKCGCQQYDGPIRDAAPVLQPFDPDQRAHVFLGTPPQNAVFEQAAAERAEMTARKPPAFVILQAAGKHNRKLVSTTLRRARASAYSSAPSAAPTRASTASGRKCSSQISARPSLIITRRRPGAGNMRCMMFNLECQPYFDIMRGFITLTGRKQ